MSNLEHYFENLLFQGCDVADDVNKNQLSKEQQEAVEECVNYVLCNIFAGRDDFREYMHKRYDIYWIGGSRQWGTD